ncbi:CheR family methyltransferase [Natrarchaeobaculum sulfurireducens]|uniref:protein-glutamate O-methyltransferase n=1 Tax=Natrarchaeobaculum sulfurireducens TaxID=2044521 RepID=A0A346PSL5_9EURY|nr:protein-glutamate O-methyltransferase CheR [Natrarchaeobaculum sulfurireducens]AXR77547.1 Methylase of chemotaxis methyl-accepting protein [Natrarchaeobaculum sulfurireducens]AXR82510.1 Chemotaxis protein methyltransferase CheR [Natrarchaeobaculum sulfurireducens]
MGADSFAALLEYMERQLNFATSHYNESYLDRRITARMRRTDSEDYDEYYDLVQSDPDEQEALLDSLSINVTGFFRNPSVWDGIRDVLRTLSDEQRRVEVWSAACADGREPYSLSMLAHDDRQIDESRLSILATDISEPALETAREGVYQESRTTDIDDQLSHLSSYEEFVEYDADDGTFRVQNAVKRPVTFERHDLINDRPKSGFDLVTCRNLFIYIESDAKRTMLETIARSLRDDGYLVIGKSETIPPELKSTFEAVDNRNRIYRRI